jgi:hypothetical protein
LLVILQRYYKMLGPIIKMILTEYARYELGGVFERQVDGMRMIILNFGKYRRCNTDRGFSRSASEASP